jgi:hypothetical protein
MLFTPLFIGLDLGNEAVKQQAPYVLEGGGGLGNFTATVLSGLFIVAALLVFFYLIWGAFDWITSDGEKGKTEKARGKITGAIIGLLVLASTLAIFALIQKIFNFQVIDFGEMTPQEKMLEKRLIKDPNQLPNSLQ